MITRCRELKLRAVGPERQLRMDFIVLLTAKTVYSLCSRSRRQWLALLGNRRLRVLPIWELDFGTLGPRLIATERLKHDPNYQERHGTRVGPAKDLSPQLIARIKGFAKRIYRTLDLDGYARIDFRLSADDTPYYIEANPNPEIARIE